MANLTEVSQWENVIRQIENGEAATGGADGLANVQAKQLANRTKWLKENYLPLTGGAFNEGAVFVSKKGDDGRLVFSGGSSKGASIELFGGESTDGAGKIVLRTRKDDIESSLHIYPDGSLKHEPINNGIFYDLAGSAIVAKSLGVSGYIKYASGIIIQWTGGWNIPTNTTEYSVSFPISFPNAVFYVGVQNEGWADANYKKYFSISKNKNSVTVYPNSAWSNSNSNDNNFVLLAIGY